MNNEGTAFIRNEKCFIRKNHDCGRYFGASKTCFIACPDPKKIGLVLEIITNKLEKEKIEPFIAVRERAYGEDIFCTKICGKIIESLFCMAILDDVEDKGGKNSPSPNVYYEYGMMTSMSKEIIPLQKADGKLAFNIQSIEVIKYTEESLADEVEKAVRKVLYAIKKKQQFEDSQSESSLFIKKVNRILELMGFDKNHRQIEDSWKNACTGTIFNPYMNNENLLLFAGIVVDREVKIDDVLTEIRLLISRLDKILLNYDDEIDNLSIRHEKVIMGIEKGYDEAKQLLVASMHGSGRAAFIKNKGKYLEKVKRDIENIKWYRKALDNVSIVIITKEEAEKSSKLIDSVTKIETKLQNLNIQIWDANKIEENSKKLGLIIED